MTATVQSTAGWCMLLPADLLPAVGDRLVLCLCMKYTEA